MECSPVGVKFFHLLYDPFSFRNCHNADQVKGCRFQLNLWQEWRKLQGYEILDL